MQVHQMYESALADDPNAFEYDGVYDSMQVDKTAARNEEKVQGKSRYIVQLKEKAEQRKREEDLAFERRQVPDDTVRPACLPVRPPACQPDCLPISLPAGRLV